MNITKEELIETLDTISNRAAKELEPVMKEYRDRISALHSYYADMMKNEYLKRTESVFGK